MTDQDGHTDRQEFITGTNPTLNTSIFCAMTITPLTGGNRIILWSAVPGRTYRVQYKNSATSPQWAGLPGDVTATASTASVLDTTASGQVHRFYRVVLAP